MWGGEGVGRRPVGGGCRNFHKSGINVTNSWMNLIYGGNIHNGGESEGRYSVENNPDARNSHSFIKNMQIII